MTSFFDNFSSNSLFLVELLMSVDWHWNDTNMTLKWHQNDAKMTSFFKTQIKQLHSDSLFLVSVDWHWNDTKMTLKWHHPKRQIKSFQFWLPILMLNSFMSVDWHWNDTFLTCFLRSFFRWGCPRIDQDRQDRIFSRTDTF